MRIAVFGLGYVGCVTGACLARMGHVVSGVDISPPKVRMIQDAHSPIAEKGMERLVARAVRAGRFGATLDPAEAMRHADLSLVTVGTPSRENGEADVRHVLHAVRNIGRALRSSRRYHVVVARSTVPPGTVRGAVIPALERSSGKKAGRDFGVCFHPEFLREGSSIHDFFHPPKTVIGLLDAPSGARIIKLWKRIRAPLFLTSIEVAEVVKYVDNAFHALKVSFANEVGSLAKNLGVDGREVMNIFASDTKLNISPLYLEPGLAFGGPCLPKDLRALCMAGRAMRVKLPLLESILESNARHLDRAVQLILATGKRRVGILGLVFKSDTDDLRESPACALVRRLLGAKRQVRIYDPRIQPERLLGANQVFVERELPELPRLLIPSLRGVLEFGEVIVLAGKHAEFASALGRLRRDQILIELVSPRWPRGKTAGRSRGICW